MATLQATTTSDPAQLDPDSIDTVEDIVDDYDFVGILTDLAVDVSESDGETSPTISIHGHAPFEATKPIRDEDGAVVDREHGLTEEFFERLAPHLQEPFVVETVGHEKCRFPLLASQWAVWPDGTVLRLRRLGTTVVQTRDVPVADELRRRLQPLSRR
jgi:hypothetical protein